MFQKNKFIYNIFENFDSCSSIWSSIPQAFDIFEEPHFFSKNFRKNTTLRKFKKFLAIHLEIVEKKNRKFNLIQIIF